MFADTIDAMTSDGRIAQLGQPGSWEISCARKAFDPDLQIEILAAALEFLFPENEQPAQPAAYVGRAGESR